MRLLLAISFILLSGPISVILGQNSDIVSGEISYVSSQNVYLKFVSTTHLSEGDTLYILDNGASTPAVVVTKKSSMSCVATPLIAGLAKGQKLYIDRSTELIAPVTSTNVVPTSIADPGGSPVYPDISPDVQTTQAIKQSIRGRFSASWYSNQYQQEAAVNTNRMRYILAFNGQNLNGGKFSAETYISFRHELNNWQEVQNDFHRAFKVYNLAVTYRPNRNMSITAGRKFNNYISNVGAIDGVQLQTYGKQWSYGAVVGSRPDYSNYRFNPDLFQLGGYVSHTPMKYQGKVQSTLGVFQQFNNWNTDRRFLYFQHTNSAIKDLYIFTSFEFDLYKKEDSTTTNTNTFDLTSVYFSLRYRLSRKLSVFASYDARDNIIYYESYKGFLDRLLEEETRQGLRTRINYRPVKYLTISASAGYRFQAKGTDKSYNANGYITYSKVPLINAATSMSYVHIKSPYLVGNIYGMRLYRDIIKGKVYGELQYRYTSYTYSSLSNKLTQSIVGASLSWRILKKLSLSFYYEGVFDDPNNTSRFHVNITQRI